MRNRRLLAVLAITLLITAIWWFFIKETNESAAKSDGPRYLPSAIVSQAKQPVKLPSTLPNLATPPPSAEIQRKRFIAGFLTPISFYGKVVDQHGDAVPDASISLAANDKPFGGKISEYSRKSDSAGLFSLTGIAGLTLAVEISKSGYKSIPPDDLKLTSSGLFEYGLSSVTGPPLPNKSNPAIFTLHKIGVTEPLVKLGEKSFRIKRDGTPLTILLDEKRHEVILRCWTKDLERPEGQNKYDWNFEINVPSGGLLIRKDAFAFEAPVEGYQPDDTINMPATLPFGEGGWDSFAERAYFIRFDDQTFARVNFRMRAGGDHFVVWESYYNPKPNSRNLEYDVTKPKPMP